MPQQRAFCSSRPGGDQGTAECSRSLGGSSLSLLLKRGLPAAAPSDSPGEPALRAALAPRSHVGAAQRPVTVIEEGQPVRQVSVSALREEWLKR